MAKGICTRGSRRTTSKWCSDIRKAYTSGSTFPTTPRSWPRSPGVNLGETEGTRYSFEDRDRPEHAIQNRDPAASCGRVGALLGDAGVIVESPVCSKDMRPCQTWVDANMSPNDALHVTGPRSENHHARSLLSFSPRQPLSFLECRQGVVADACRLAASWGKLGSNRTCDRYRSQRQ